MLAASFLIAAATRKYPVRIGYAPFAGQLITMVLRTGGGSMLPLGIIFMGFLGLWGVLAAALGVKAGNRWRGQKLNISRSSPESGFRAFSLFNPQFHWVNSRME